MDEHGATRPPVGACAQCGGVLVAAHMLTKTYAIAEDGRWMRSLADFAEDVVIVCRLCSAQQEGRIDEDGSSFVFVRTAAG